MRQFHRALAVVFTLAFVATPLGAPASAQTRMSVLRGRVAALGASVRDVTAADATAAKVEAGKGAYVVSVVDDGPAAKAGIKAGDVILDFDGQPVRSAAMLSRLVTETPAGRAVKVVVVREGKRVELGVAVEAGEGGFTFAIPNVPGVEGRQFSVRPPILVWPPSDEEQQSPPRFDTPTTPRFAPPLWRYDNGAQLGVTVQELTSQLREYFGVRQGVLVSSVAADSAAARAGMKAGDVITMVDKTVVRTSDDLRRMLDDRHVGDRAAVSIVRDRKPMTLTVTLEGARARVRPIDRNW